MSRIGKCLSTQPTFATTG
jgi:hypothetical protein